MDRFYQIGHEELASSLSRFLLGDTMRSTGDFFKVFGIVRIGIRQKLLKTKNKKIIKSIKKRRISDHQNFI